MNYPNTCEAIFLDRPNRFIAHVDLDGKTETVHVKNTGRCKELLLPGSKVILSKSENPARKTAYDLIGVYKDGIRLFNIDSQVPNHVVGEWLQTQEFTLIKPEYTFGDSRIDFYMERDSERWLLEVKGCTLERDGIGYSPMRLRSVASSISGSWRKPPGRDGIAPSPLSSRRRASPRSARTWRLIPPSVRRWWKLRQPVSGCCTCPAG